MINKVSNEIGNKNNCCSHIKNATPYYFLINDFVNKKQKLIKQLICGICNIKYYEGEYNEF